MEERKISSKGFQIDPKELDKLNAVAEQRIDAKLAEMLIDGFNGQFEQQNKEIKKKIWDYTLEHPIKDHDVVISPKTHDLIIEELDCFTDKNYQSWIYPKHFFFKRKETIYWDSVEEKIREYEREIEENDR